MACQRRIALKAVLHQTLHQRLTVSQGRQAVTQITGRNNAQLLTQASGRTAIVRRGHDSSTVISDIFHTAQQRRQACATAHNGNRRTMRQLTLHKNCFHQRAAFLRQNHRNNRADQAACTIDHDSEANYKKSYAQRHNQAIRIASCRQIGHLKQQLLRLAHQLIIKK